MDMKKIAILTDRKGFSKEMEVDRFQPVIRIAEPVKLSILKTMTPMEQICPEDYIEFIARGNIIKKGTSNKKEILHYKEY